MNMRTPVDQISPHSTVSTGHLPPTDLVQTLVTEAHDRFKSVDEGNVADYIPALAKVPRELFGLCIVGSSGAVYAAGNTDYEFSIQSVSKPFVFALICQGTFAPPLDTAGNSVKGQLFTQFLSQQLGLNYKGKQQAQALGILGAVQAITTVTAFFLVGALGTWVGWRYALMAIVILGNALTFLVPLYIQMMQGRTSFQTSVAMIPYQLAVFAAAISLVRMFDRLTPRQIARYAFMLEGSG